jgi:hypothetical protein
MTRTDKGGRDTAISQQVRLIQKLVDNLEEGDAEVDQQPYGNSIVNTT